MTKEDLEKYCNELKATCNKYIIWHDRLSKALDKAADKLSNSWLLTNKEVHMTKEQWKEKLINND